MDYTDVSWRQMFQGNKEILGHLRTGLNLLSDILKIISYRTLGLPLTPNFSSSRHSAIPLFYFIVNVSIGLCFVIQAPLDR